MHELGNVDMELVAKAVLKAFPKVKTAAWAASGGGDRGGSGKALIGGGLIGAGAGAYLGAQKSGLEHVAKTTGKSVADVKALTKAQRLTAAPSLAAGKAGRTGLRTAIQAGLKGGALKGALVGGLGLMALKKMMG